jgi:hypothetical protein
MDAGTQLGSNGQDFAVPGQDSVNAYEQAPTLQSVRPAELVVPAASQKRSRTLLSHQALARCRGRLTPRATINTLKILPPVLVG